MHDRKARGRVWENSTLLSSQNVSVSLDGNLRMHTFLVGILN